MYSKSLQKYLLWLLSLNLIYHISDTNCQTTSKKSQSLGINAKTKKDKEKDIKNVIKVPKEVESETQMAIDHLPYTIEYKELLNNSTTSNETLNLYDHANLRYNESFVTYDLNETTPLYLSTNLTTNGSMMSIIEETLDYTNDTEIDGLSSANITTQLSLNYSTTPFDVETNDTDVTEIPEYDNTTATEVTQHLNESPNSNTTITGIGSATESSVDLDKESSGESSVKCVFEKEIVCRGIPLECFGSGEVDCGFKSGRRRRKRGDSRSATGDDIVNVTLEDNSSLKVYKQYLEKRPISERIDNEKCVLTAHPNWYFVCTPLPTIIDCKGKSVCLPVDDKHANKSQDSLPIWKVGLIAALTAIGAVCFIVTAVIAYISYNKLKVRPEMSANGYHNNNNNITDSVTRV